MTDVIAVVIGIIGIIVAAFVAWLAYAAYEKPKSTNFQKDAYIDDFARRRIQVLKCSLSWGTRLFPYRHLRLYEPPLNSDVMLQYLPSGGIETDLPDDYFEVTPSQKKKGKIVRLKDKSFFTRESINEVTLTIETPIERSLYARKVTSKPVGDTLWISNENSEEVRNFRFGLSRPIRLDKLSVVAGTINAVAIQIPYPAVGKLSSKRPTR